MSTNKQDVLTFWDKPVVIALFGPKGSGKTSVADMLGFPQYQFNQWAIEQVSKTTNLSEYDYKRAELKDTQTRIHNMDTQENSVATPRQYLIDYIDDCIQHDSTGYIAKNFAHFKEWLESKEIQDSYAVTLPSIRREFELIYLEQLTRAGYQVICVELVREGCKYSDEHATEQNLFQSKTWELSNMYGGGYYQVLNDNPLRRTCSRVLGNIAVELLERESYL